MNNVEWLQQLSEPQPKQNQKAGAANIVTAPESTLGFILGRIIQAVRNL
jgi:hypothetical protein